MILEQFPEIGRLLPSEKLLLVSELWNDLEENAETVPVSREIVADLEQRMAHFQRHPSEFTTWEATKEKLLPNQASE